MRTVVVTPPAIEPITLAEAKNHCKVDVDLTEDDDLITALISAARILCEAELSQTLITTTVDAFLDEWPRDRRGYHLIQDIRVFKPPLQSVTSITYYDTAGTLQTLDASAYLVSTGFPGRISLAPLQFAPLIQCGRADAIKIRMVVGYGDDATDIPQNIKAAILLTVGCLYENRGEDAFELPAAACALLGASDHGHYA